MPGKVNLNKKVDLGKIKSEKAKLLMKKDKRIDRPDIKVKDQPRVRLRKKSTR